MFHVQSRLHLLSFLPYVNICAVLPHPFTYSSITDLSFLSNLTFYLIHFSILYPLVFLTFFCQPTHVPLTIALTHTSTFLNLYHAFLDAHHYPQPLNTSTRIALPISQFPHHRSQCLILETPYTLPVTSTLILSYYTAIPRLIVILYPFAL